VPLEDVPHDCSHHKPRNGKSGPQKAERRRRQAPPHCPASFPAGQVLQACTRKNTKRWVQATTINAGLCLSSRISFPVVCRQLCFGSAEVDRAMAARQKLGRAALVAELSHESSVAAEPGCASASVTSNTTEAQPARHANFGAGRHEYSQPQNFHRPTMQANRRRRRFGRRSRHVHDRESEFERSGRSLIGPGRP
jgi:hypothetical protein